ncbi:MAG: bifunctional folylpolyglutamate synthase/dihydrofolate synthase [Desulfurispora sp.]|uniref:bifunctional folylpolyglutamate synthase/dihydrofolate synthase n=1 Tax=Desulfurispora sp. TaxID=3014275 RepID=UPI00404B301D
MNYQQALEFLQNLTKFGINLGLGRITHLLGLLGNPQEKLQIVHIGGTNGKGSTSAMVAAVLQEAGYQTGVFTSPHLHDYTERYCINGRPADREDLAALLTEMRPYLEKMVDDGLEHPTEFEVCTALAFLYFYRRQVDYLVLEVGLGGAIDSTNVVHPLVAVITNVALDHMDYLGQTIGEIATAKAGIIKPNTPVVTAATGEALDVIQDFSRRHAAPLYVVGRDITWQEKSFRFERQVIDVQGRLAMYRDLALPLPGRHQQINAATAVAALEVLIEKRARITPQQLRSGLARVQWPARLEVLRRSPLVLLDGAHNHAGAAALAAALRDCFAGRRIHLVLGMLGDKERSKVLAELAPCAASVVVTRPNSPRAGDWQQLAEEARRFVPDVQVVEDVAGAVEAALGRAGSEDVVLITGSLYMVGEARELFT